MPTNRRFVARRRAGSTVIEVGPWQEMALELGPRLVGRNAGWPVDDPEPFAEAWHFHGERILNSFIGRHPGHRAWGWWIFQHDGERPVINPVSPEHEPGLRARNTDFGILANPFNIYHGYNAPPGVILPWLEESPDYLRRLGLLLPGELARYEGEHDEWEAFHQSTPQQVSSPATNGVHHHENEVPTNGFSD